MSKIRELNDAFRTTFIGGRVMLTCGVNNCGDEFKREVLARIQTFKVFNDDNDPHGEHDFGAFDVEGEKLFWKIDYFDETIEYGSQDPADPEKTTRVLTVMLASEY